MTYRTIANHYNLKLQKHGDSPEGLDWPNKPDDLDKRHSVMLEICKSEIPVRILDFGCGTGMLYEYIIKNNLTKKYSYHGLDINNLSVEFSQKKFPDATFINGDVLQNQSLINIYDYIIMNGVLTVKSTLTKEEMWEFTKNLLSILFEKSKIGIAFNVMSQNVDWQRDDLNHLSMDKLTKFLTENLSRNFIIRNDYGLYEYTTYLYK